MQAQRLYPVDLVFQLSDSPDGQVPRGKTEKADAERKKFLIEHLAKQHPQLIVTKATQRGSVVKTDREGSTYVFDVKGLMTGRGPGVG